MPASEPKYAAIASDLRARIDDGEYAPGDRLPAQHALAAEYAVTLMTLRQALAELEREGVVHASKGRGTFVSSQPAVRLGLDHLSSFAQEMDHQGTVVDTEVLSIREHAPVPTSVRDLLGVDADAELVELVRRRSIAGVPVVVQHSTLPAPMWSRIADVDLTATSLYDALRDHAGRSVERASETFRAIAAADHIADLLRVPAGAPCLESTRVSYAGERPFLHDRAVLLGTAAEVRAERTATGLRLGYRTTA